MLYSSASKYPDKIDKMTFFNDVDLLHREAMDKYNTLISQGKYDEANEFMSQQEGIYLYSADFLNLIENRIRTLQNYLLTKGKKQPFIFSKEEPSDIKVDYIWI